jgi:predicted DNA binding CopG/RHH family protein
MKKEYDFSRSRKNPYAARLKKQITIRLNADTISYFKKLALEEDLPYQRLIDMYLSDCAQTKRRPEFSWK